MKNPMSLFSLSTHRRLSYFKRITAGGLLVFVLAVGVFGLGGCTSSISSVSSVSSASVGDTVVAGDTVPVDGRSGDSDTLEPEDLIRFHILANSDSSQDQELKYAVRDAVVTLIGPRLAEMTSIEQARQELRNSEDLIVACAEDVIEQRGYSYPVALAWEVREFPTRAYGSVTLPAGEYEAVRILIGEAAGANWWCVLFPPLCFVQDSAPALPSDTNAAVNNALDPNKANSQTQEIEEKSKTEQKPNTEPTATDQKTPSGAKDYQPEHYQKKFFFMDFVKNLFGQ